MKRYRRRCVASENPGDVPTLSAGCSHLGYSHPVLKPLKFRKLLIKPANLSEKHGWAVRLFAATHTPLNPPTILILILILISQPLNKNRENTR